jgi:integrase
MVPLEYRVFYAFDHREGMRKREAKRLAWPDLDLERGIVALDENKTDPPRS